MTARSTTKASPSLACRLGRCFCGKAAEISTGDPHPLRWGWRGGEFNLPNAQRLSLSYVGLFASRHSSPTRKGWGSEHRRTVMPVPTFRIPVFCVKPIFMISVFADPPQTPGARYTLFRNRIVCRINSRIASSKNVFFAVPSESVCRAAGSFRVQRPYAEYRRDRGRGFAVIAAGKAERLQRRDRLRGVRD